MIQWEHDNDLNYFLRTEGNKFVTKENFDDFFGGVSSYDDLINHTKTTDGWKKIFYEWKQKGILD